MENSDDVAQYWRAKEQELGEPVLMKSISHTFMPGGVDSFGILYASATVLAYEYSKGARRSVIDVLLARRRDEQLAETIRLARSELIGVGLVSTPLARRWLRREVSPVQAAEWIKGMRRPSLVGVLGGTSLCVCTAREMLVFDTPANRQWLTLLKQ